MWDLSLCGEVEVGGGWVGGWVGERGEAEKNKKTYNSNIIYFFSTNIYLIGTVTCTMDLNNKTIIPTFG